MFNMRGNFFWRTNDKYLYVGSTDKRHIAEGDSRVPGREGPGKMTIWNLLQQTENGAIINPNKFRLFQLWYYVLGRARPS